MQLKKQILLFLAFFVLVSNSGLAFNVHYCGQKIASISSVFSNEEVCDMTTEEEDSCCAKKEASHKKCCSDKEVNLKDKTEKVTYKTVSFDFDLFHQNDLWKPSVYNLVSILSHSQNVEYYCDANAPPLYQLYCQFILFG